MAEKSNSLLGGELRVARGNSDNKDREFEARENRGRSRVGECFPGASLLALLRLRVIRPVSFKISLENRTRNQERRREREK